MRTLFAAAAFAVAGVASVQAADIAAMTGHVTKLEADSSALVYYTAAPDGFHVVVTTQQGLTDRAAVARFETVLAAGQSAAVSIPRAAGARRGSAQQRRRPPASPSRTAPFPPGDFRVETLSQFIAAPPKNLTAKTCEQQRR
jgi:hypothetical protein